MTIEFVKTKFDGRTSNEEFSMFVDGRLEKTRISVNYKIGLDQRALHLVKFAPLSEEDEIKGDDLDSVHKNYAYLCTLYGIHGNLKKDYPHTYKEVKSIF